MSENDSKTIKKSSHEKSVVNALLWKFVERFGVMGIQFILQVILARLLSPEHYGMLSIMIIFTSLANVFIQNGFNTSLIQNKDVTEEDYSSVLCISLIVSVVIYTVLFLGAPLIATFYDMPNIIFPLRILALMLFPGALNSVQLAKVRRELDFKKVFVSNVGGIILSGTIGIVIAYNGGGIWALVVQNLLHILVTSVIMSFTVKLKFRFVCNLERIKVLFSYGWKLLVSSLLDTLYQELRSLVIGKKYDSKALGYYNRGKQFPQFIINAVNGTVQAVMLPVMSAEQDDNAKVKDMTRNSIMLSSYIILPIMTGLAAVATPLISVLLTDKWLPSVPYVQIYCFTLAFYPIHSCNLQAINAMGRSDIFLKLEIIKKTIGILALVVAVFLFDSPIAIAMTGVFTTFISCFINAYPNKKLINYSYYEQMKDILPSFIISIVMCGLVSVWGLLDLNNLLTLILQIITGVITYLLLSYVFKLKPFFFVKHLILSILKKKV